MNVTPGLDELASAVLVADSSEPGSLVRLAELADKVGAVVPGGLADTVRACRDALTAAQGASSEARARCLERVAEMLMSAEEAGQSRATVAATGAVFTLPEWVDRALLDEYIGESRLTVEEIEGFLLDAESGKVEALGKLRRMLHTLKGEAGALGLEDIVALCHAWESWMEVPSASHWIDLQLQARDWLRDAFDAYERGEMPSPSGAEMAELLKVPGSEEPEVLRLGSEAVAEEAQGRGVAGEAELAGERYPASVERDEETVLLIGEFITETEEGLSAADVTLMSIEKEGVNTEVVHGLFRTFHTIKGVAGALEIGEMTKLAHTTEAMLNLVRQNTLALGGPVLDLVFDSTAMMREMLSVLRTAVDAGTELVVPTGYAELVASIGSVVEGRPAPAAKLPKAPQEAKLGEILTMPPMAVPRERVERALGDQARTGKRLGEQLVSDGGASPKQVAQALRVQREAAEQGTPQSKLRETIKVDLARVDALVEMIGELVIVETMVVNAEEIAGLTSPRVRTHLAQLAKITRDLQDVGMRMRMVPVRSVFQKMGRMVRDLGRKGGKEVRLVTEGESTEMDRSMVQQIADPLVHMIRNAVDHAIETVDERLAAGKSATGTITLAAYHEGGSIVIEVGDDGRGLRREPILKKAISNGLISAGDSLTDAEVHNLVFAPGFSTAARVTEISGRGVGMDVVKRNVERMRGRILISTEAGRGTTFKIVLPLTLAIIDGMLVAVGQERYIIPTLSIVQSIQLEPSMLTTLRGARELVNVRGELFPLIRLERVFDVEGARTADDVMTGLVVVIESLGKKVGLLVDEVVTQQQVVIKSLDGSIAQMKFVAGAAILSDGRVGLILNTDAIGCLTNARQGVSPSRVMGTMA